MNNKLPSVTLISACLLLFVSTAFSGDNCIGNIVNNSKKPVTFYATAIHGGFGIYSKNQTSCSTLAGGQIKCTIPGTSTCKAIPCGVTYLIWPHPNQNLMNTVFRIKVGTVLSSQGNIHGKWDTTPQCVTLQGKVCVGSTCAKSGLAGSTANINISDSK